MLQKEDIHFIFEPYPIKVPSKSFVIVSVFLDSYIGGVWTDERWTESFHLLYV